MAKIKPKLSTSTPVFINDSMSTYQPNPFSPHYVKPPVVQSTHPIHKDTLEISAEKLKKEALERLHHTSKYTIVHPSLMRIGKYLFLGIALPPYVVVIGIPKFVILTVLPAIYTLLVKIIDKTNAQVKKGANVVIQRMKKVLKEIQKTTRGLIQPLMNIFLAIGSRINELRQNFLKLFARKPKEKIAATQNKWKGTASQFLQFIAKGPQQLYQRLIGALLFPWKKLLNFNKNVKIGLQKVRSAPKQLLTNIANHFTSKLMTSQRAAHITTEWLAKQLNLCKQDVIYASSLVKKFLQFINQPITHSLKKAAEKFKRLGSFLKKKKQHAQSFFQKGAAKFKTLSRFFVMDKIFPPFLYMWIPQYIRNLLKKLFWNKWTIPFYKLGRLMVKGLFLIVPFIFKGIQALFKLISAGLKIGKATLGTSLKATKALIPTALSVVGKGLSLCSRFMRRSFYLSLVFLFMFILLAVSNFRSLGRLSSRILFQKTR